MQLNTQIKEELTKAIQNRNADTFEYVTSGNLKHFVSSEGKKRGLYVDTVDVDGKEFKIYMV
jgi:hypothetical protein